MKKQPKKPAAAKTKPQLENVVVESKETVLPTATIKPTRSTVSEEKVRARAYEIFQQTGGVPGHDTEHWLQAERELLRQN